MIQSPTVADFARLSALVCAARHALRDLYPRLRTDWQPIRTLALACGHSESVVKLESKALAHLGLAELGEGGVREVTGAGADAAAANLTVLDYYSTFAARDFPANLGDHDGRMGDYYQLLEHVARPTYRFLREFLSTTLPLRILDYGCGLAPHTRNLLKAMPSATAVLVEREEVLPALVAAIAEDGLVDRAKAVSVHEASRFSEPIHDVVLVLNVLHEMTRDDQAKLVSSLAELLAPGGRLIVQAFCRDLVPAWHSDALEMATAIRLGSASDVLELGEYLRLIESTGLIVSETPTVPTVGGPANRIIIATRSQLE